MVGYPWRGFMKCAFDNKIDCIAESIYGECEIVDGYLVLWRCSNYNSKSR